MASSRTNNGQDAAGSKLFIPLRAEPTVADGNDQKRIELVRNRRWGSQDDLWRHRNRQIEENVRMLAGQQWSEWHPILNRWIDITDWMDEKERRWRKRPVFNRLLPWFILTHARLTENPPIVTFVPGPDRIDAELAEMMDIAHKTLWREVGMVDIVDRLMAWLIPAGRAHLQTRVDLNKGPLIPWVGLADVPMVDPTGSPIIDPNTGEPVIHPDVPDVPFDKDGNPLAVIGPDGLQITGKAHSEREGKIVVDVLSPLEVRYQWGPQPVHEKRWHAVRSFLTPEQIWEQHGIEVKPDTSSQAGDYNELERLLYGTGFFGAHNATVASQTTTTHLDGYVEVTSLWEAPCPYPGMEETDESPGGRLCIVTKNQVIYDGPRPVRHPYTSPIRTFDFVRMPGRPSGTSPQDAMNPPQRAYNRGYAQIQEHVALVTNPKAIVDTASGIKDGTWDNEPGTGFRVNRRPGVPAVEFVSPPPLGEDVYVLQKMLLAELTDMGNLHGTQGEMPAPDASGELVKELRFNSDRFLGPTVRRAVEEFARLTEDWIAILPTIWDQKKTLSYTGDDNVARTLVVLPHMFEKGKINVVPDVESMLPEGRGERQSRIWAMYMNGMFGPAGSPEALRRFFDLARFPHMGRTAKPGGTDRTMAEQENGRLMMGEDPATIPVYPWYDDNIHLGVHTEFMKSPEFLQQPKEVQDAFTFHWQAHLQNMMAKAPPPAPVGPDGKPMPGSAAPGPSGQPATEGGAVAPGPPSPPAAGTPSGGQMPTQLAGAQA